MQHFKTIFFHKKIKGGCSGNVRILENYRQSADSVERFSSENRVLRTVFSEEDNNG
jgi:hypothetical protein